MKKKCYTRPQISFCLRQYQDWAEYFSYRNVENEISVRSKSLFEDIIAITFEARHLLAVDISALLMITAKLKMRSSKEGERITEMWKHNLNKETSQSK